MTLSELEKLLQGNRIDLRNLNRQQKIFIDEAQKSGAIDTKPLDVMMMEHEEAARKVAERKELVADPIRKKTEEALGSDIVNRDNVQMLFDIGFLTTQLLFDRKRLAGAMLNPKKFIGDLNKIKSSFNNPALNKLVTGLKQVGAISKGFGPVVSQSAMRAALAGALGYSAGGVAYDLADEIARDQMGIKAKVGDVTYKDMMQKNKLLRAADDFRGNK